MSVWVRRRYIHKLAATVVVVSEKVLRQNGTNVEMAHRALLGFHSNKSVAHMSECRLLRRGRRRGAPSFIVAANLGKPECRASTSRPTTRQTKNLSKAPVVPGVDYARAMISAPLFFCLYVDTYIHTYIHT